MIEKGPQDLGFGLRHSIDPKAQASWGARALWEGDGRFSLLWDRQDIWAADAQSKAKLKAALNGPGHGDGALAKANDRSEVLARKHSDAPHAEQYRWDGDCDAVLYEDDVVIVMGNPRMSCGYIHLAAWLKPEPVEPFRGCP